MLRLRPGPIVFLVLAMLACSQARIVIFTREQDGDAASAEAGVQDPDAEATSDTSVHYYPLLTWFRRGQMAEHQADVEDMLRRVRCSRLRAALREYQNSKRWEQEEARSDLLGRRSPGEGQQGSLLSSLMSQSLSSIHRSADILTTSRDQSDSDSTLLSDMVPAVEDEDEHRQRGSFSYSDDPDTSYALDSAKDSDGSWEEAVESKPVHRRREEELDQISLNTVGAGSDSDGASQQSVLDTQEAAQMQREIDYMLSQDSTEAKDAEAAGASSTDDQETLVGGSDGEDPHADTADQAHSMLSALLDTQTLTQHLLRGVEAGQKVTQEQVEALGAEAAEGAAAEGEDPSMHPGHAGSQLLVIYPYDRESDDVFALQGDLSSGDPHSHSHALLHPLTYLASVMRDLGAHLDYLFTLQQQAALQRIIAQHSAGATTSEPSYAYDDDDAEDDAFVDADGGDHPGSRGFFELLTGKDSNQPNHPLFLSSWWGPSSAVGPHPVDLMAAGGGDDWPRAAPSDKSDERTCKMGVVLLCVLLLAVAAMVVAFIQGLGSLRRVMRRQELIVPFLVESPDGTYQQGYMLVDEDTLRAAAEAGSKGQGFSPSQVTALPSRGGSFGPMSDSVAQAKEQAQAQWDSKLQTQSSREAEGKVEAAEEKLEEETKDMEKQ